MKKLFLFLFLVSFFITGENVKEEKTAGFLKQAADSYMKIISIETNKAGNIEVFKKRFFRSLRRAARNTSDKIQKDYLLTIMAEFRKSGKIPNNLIPGAGTKYNLLFTGEVGKKRKIAVVIEIDEKLSAHLQKVTDKIIELAEKGELGQKINYLPKNILFLAGKVLNRANFSRGTITYLSMNNSSERFPVVLFLADKIESFLVNSVKPVVAKLSPKLQWSEKEDQLFLTSLLLHRFSHFLGPALVKNDKKKKRGDESENSENDQLLTPDKKLKKSFQVIEELRAEANSFHLLEMIRRNNLIDEKELKNIIEISLLSKIAMVKKEKKSMSAVSGIIFLNELFEHGISVNLASKNVVFDPENLKKRFEKLKNKYTEFELKGNLKESKKYISENKNPGNILKTVLGFI